MIKGADLIAPTGKIEGASMFPGASSTDLAKRLQSYLDEGAKKAESITNADAAIQAATREEAAVHWAYYRAYEAIFLRMNASPSSWSVQGDGTASFTATQIANFENLMRTEFDAYLELIPATAGGETADARRPASTTIPNRFVW